MNLLEESIGEIITEKSYTSCGLRKETSKEYMDLAENGHYKLIKTTKQQVPNDSKGQYQLYCIMVDKEDDKDTERLMYVGKGNDRRYETHCDEIKKQRTKCCFFEDKPSLNCGVYTYWSHRRVKHIWKKLTQQGSMYRPLNSMSNKSTKSKITSVNVYTWLKH
uniref:GIY-YIG domain-containing protein n=1 Tax=Strongyloides venezuelensis TaxID=75913 RepID=A0A0K0G1U8_STRVS